MEIKDGMVLAFLGFNTWSDIRVHRIQLWSMGVFGVLGIIYGVCSGELSLSITALSLLPGIFLLSVGKVTQEALGYGDGIAVMVLGIYTGIRQLVFVLMIALMLAAIWAAILMMFCKKQKNQEFPFLPFLLLGYIGGIWF